MNQDQAKDKWDQIRGGPKKARSEFSDNGFKKAESSADTFFYCGIVRGKPGETKGSTKTKFDTTAT